MLAVLCVNALGSCYGSSGPPPDATLSPAERAERFPVVTVGDIVATQQRALTMIGYDRFAAILGGSLGGMQAIRWALSFPEAVAHCVAIGAYDFFSAMGIALNAIAREAIRNGGPRPESGIELARKIAMLTYKSEALLAERYDRRPDRGGGDPSREPSGRFDVEGYLDHQGAVFSKRMDPASYLVLTRAMDLFETRDVALDARHAAVAYTFAGISSDWLFLPRYVREAATRFALAGADSVYVELVSTHGHDAFLAEPDLLGALVRPRLAALSAALGAPVAPAER